MAVSIPATAQRQPSGGFSMDEGGGFSAVVSWKGDYSDLAECAAEIGLGDSITVTDLPGSWLVRSFDLQRVNADLAVLTISLKHTDESSQSESGSSTTPIRDVWSLKSVRNDVSVLAYCGTSANNPNRAVVEKWMREPDAKLANEHKYTDGDGQLVDIAADPLISYTVPLIEKIQAGTERVIRFYPQITRRRTYYNAPADAFSNLSYVEEPPYSAGPATLSPDGIAAVIGDHEWLKVQDDCDEQSDGKWVRTESWIGILKTDATGDHPWDPDLYGEDRWQMPADAPGDNGGSS